jgi:hypothetical protein
MNSYANKNSIHSIQQESQEKLIKFKGFISKFRILSLPYSADPSNYNPDSLHISLDMDNDSIFVGFVGPGVAVGMFPDTSKFFAIIYCYATYIYFPRLSVYSKDGRLIDEKNITQCDGSEIGYNCSEILKINSMKDITVIRMKEKFEYDSNGNRIKETYRKEIWTTQYSIGETGTININTFRNN